MLFLQLCLYCLLFFLLVKAAVRNDGRNCLYFYPKEYIDEAAKRGLADPAATMAKGKRFMIPFCIFMLLALLAILVYWNRVTDFRTAYGQSVLFLVVMNWFDGLVIDGLWVRRSKIWRIAGMEGIPYIKPLKSVLIKRTAGTVLYFIIALPAAGAAVLAGSIF